MGDGSIFRGQLPALHLLHQRHPGLYQPLCEVYADAAVLCFREHHQPPVDILVERGPRTSRWTLAYPEPTHGALPSMNNEEDRTRDGAYSVALSVVEGELGLLAVSRAESRTGADWYCAPLGTSSDDFEAASKLEVSGVNRGDQGEIRRRLTEKVRQVVSRPPNLPAIACVVGFKERLVLLEEAVGRYG